MRLARALKNLRLSKKMTQGELADILRVRRNYVYMIESARAWPGRKLLKKYSEFFGFNYLLLLSMVANERVEQYKQRVYNRYKIK